MSNPAGVTVPAAANASGEDRDAQEPSDLLRSIGTLLDQWPTLKVENVEPIDLLPTLVDSPVREDFLASIMRDAAMLARSQRLIIDTMASTAIEHEGAWRLGLAQVDDSAQLRWSHLTDVMQLERRHGQARRQLLSNPRPGDIGSPASKAGSDAAKPAVIDPALREMADRWAIDIARRYAHGPRPDIDEDEDEKLQTKFLDKYAPSRRTPPDTADTRSGTDDEHPLRAVLTQWMRLLADQRIEMRALGHRQDKDVERLRKAQEEQSRVARGAIQRSDDYRNNVAITLVAFAVALMAIVLSLFRVWPRSGLAPGVDHTLVNAVVSLVAEVLAVGAASTVVLRSALMGVTYRPGKLKYSRHVVRFMWLLVPMAILYTANALLMFSQSDASTLARVFGPVLLGTAGISTVAVLILRRPRHLREAIDDLAEDAAGFDIPDAAALPGSRVAGTFQALRTVAARRETYWAGQAARWGRLTLMLGIPATVLTGLGAATGFTDLTTRGPGKYIVASIALVGSALAGVATSLNAGGRAEAANSRAASFEALARELRIVRSVDLRRWSWAEKRASVDDFMARINALSGVTDQPSLYSRRHPSASTALRPGAPGGPGGSNGRAGAAGSSLNPGSADDAAGDPV